jgi:hypothetical protein
VRDAFSYFTLAAFSLARANAVAVQTQSVRLFRLYGLPEAIKNDNGAASGDALSWMRISWKYSLATCC